MKLLRDIERIAFDSGSARKFGPDGHLHVLNVPISKANVCPYRGEEIPNYKALGLDANRVYMMLRDPEELRKAASTFNGLPLLDEHIYVSSEDHPDYLTVGSTGSSCVFDGEYLRNQIAVWKDKSIKLIETDRKKQISSGYHYDPDMTPGVFKGVAYDGVMRNIRGNHVALVPKGRAGSDVVVTDAALKRPRIYGVTSTKFRRSFI